MHHHQVFFWLKSELSNSEIYEFVKGLESLIKIPLVTKGYFGKPASTNRVVVDNTYSYSLALHFKDLSEHNLYQDDPIHQNFVNQNSLKWVKVLVYDVEVLEL